MEGVIAEPLRSKTLGTKLFQVWAGWVSAWGDRVGERAADGGSDGQGAAEQGR